MLSHRATWGLFYATAAFLQYTGRHGEHAARVAGELGHTDLKSSVRHITDIFPGLDSVALSTNVHTDVAEIEVKALSVNRLKHKLVQQQKCAATWFVAQGQIICIWTYFDLTCPVGCDRVICQKTNAVFINDMGCLRHQCTIRMPEALRTVQMV